MLYGRISSALPRLVHPSCVLSIVVQTLILELYSLLNWLIVIFRSLSELYDSEMKRTTQVFGHSFFGGYNAVDVISLFQRLTFNITDIPKYFENRRQMKRVVTQL